MATSSAGYGMFWDHYSRSWWNKPQEKDRVSMSKVSATVWVGQYQPQQAGDVYVYYSVADAFGAGGGLLDLTLRLDDTVCQDWHNHNHPNAMSCRLQGLTAGHTYSVFLNTTLTSGAAVYVRQADPAGNSFTSDAEDALSLFLLFPEEALAAGQTDAVVAQARRLTGPAPMLGLWAYGFWQCKEHYHNRSEILSAAAEFRQRQLPVDNIVQGSGVAGTCKAGGGSRFLHPPSALVRRLALLGRPGVGPAMGPGGLPEPRVHGGAAARVGFPLHGQRLVQV
jgi:alpha-D-xyloside xylohydrolase